MTDHYSLACPVCRNTESQPFIEIPQIPVYCNILWDTAAGAKSAPRGDMQLAFCDQCGHIFNTRFDSGLMNYNQSYENSLHHSPRFQAYASNLVDEWIERYDIRHKNIVEIGAGQGDFLQMMCQAGSNRGVGFDPSYLPKKELPEYLSFVPDYYTEKYGAYPADVLLCRHVLEHIKNAAEFVNMVRRVIGDRSKITALFEVPNVLWTVRELGIWDIIYEHCSYFSPFSLSHVFRQNRFHVERVNTVFGGQFLTIEASPAEAAAPRPDDHAQGIASLAADVGRFSAAFEKKMAAWRARFDTLKQNDQKAVIWGAGSKGVTFLNMLNPQGVVEYAVDINPRKKGMFVAGMGQQIVNPTFLRNYQPEVVIIMNRNYEQEISQTLQELGVSATILVA